MVNFALMFLMALFVFNVPLKGSFLTLLLGVADLRHHDDGLWHADLGLHPHPDRGAVRHRHSDRSAGDTVFRHMVPVSSLSGMAQIMGRGFPMTYFLPVSVGTFTKGLGFSGPRYEFGRIGCLHPGPDVAEPSPAAQAGALSQRAAMQNIRQHLLARHQGTAQLPARFRAAGAGHLRVLARRHRASAKQFAGSAQCVDRHRRRGSFGTVAPHRSRVPAALLPAAAADRRAGHRPVDE